MGLYECMRGCIFEYLCKCVCVCVCVWLQKKQLEAFTVAQKAKISSVEPAGGWVGAGMGGSTTSSSGAHPCVCVSPIKHTHTNTQTRIQNSNNQLHWLSLLVRNHIGKNHKGAVNDTLDFLKRARKWSYGNPVPRWNASPPQRET